MYTDVDMETDALLRYLFGQSSLSSPTLARWIQSSKQFGVFAERYKKKIRKRIADTLKHRNRAEKIEKLAEKIEELKDMLFELEIAYLMLGSGRFSVEYERYGKEGPDFTVTDETGVVFNVEVKRIRAGNTPQVRFDMWKSYVRSRVCVLPSRLALYMKFSDEVDTSLDLVERLENGTPEIIEFITNTVPTAERAILFEESSFSQFLF